MLEAWSTGILQACHAAKAMALVVVLELAACSPQFIAWFAASELA
jgi:hypothetical protein